jgi:hypothetical protein
MHQTKRVVAGSGRRLQEKMGNSLDHRPKRFSTLVVSMVCMERGSTLIIGFSDRKGMMVVRGPEDGDPRMSRLDGLNVAARRSGGERVIDCVPTGGWDCVKPSSAIGRSPSGEEDGGSASRKTGRRVGISRVLATRHHGRCFCPILSQCALSCFC